MSYHTLPQLESVFLTMFIKSGWFNDENSNYKVKKGMKQFVYQPKSWLK